MTVKSPYLYPHFPRNQSRSAKKKKKKLITFISRERTTSQKRNSRGKKQKQEINVWSHFFPCNSLLSPASRIHQPKNEDGEKIEKKKTWASDVGFSRRLKLRQSSRFSYTNLLKWGCFVNRKYKNERNQKTKNNEEIKMLVIQNYWV